MKRSGFIKRAKPMRRSDPALPASGKPRARTHVSDPIPAKIRAAVKERSGGVCEAGCAEPAVHVHHRKLRSQGGKHELPNLLHLCLACHEGYHAKPLMSYMVGALVRSTDDPALVPFHHYAGFRPWGAL